MKIYIYRVYINNVYMYVYDGLNETNLFYKQRMKIIFALNLF